MSYPDDPTPLKVNYRSLDYRLYSTLSSCYGYLDKDHARQAALREKISQLLKEYESSVIEAHNRRN